MIIQLSCNHYSEDVQKDQAIVILSEVEESTCFKYEMFRQVQHDIYILEATFLANLITINLTLLGGLHSHDYMQTPN